MTIDVLIRRARHALETNQPNLAALTIRAAKIEGEGNE